MADTTNLKYVIDGFDQDHMVLFVTFPDDHKKVNIGVSKLPTSQAELDAIVKPFAAPVETAASDIAAVKSADPSFIKGLVGKTQVTVRYSTEQAAAAAIAGSGSSNDLVVVGGTTDVKSNIKAADEAYIKKLIEDVLATKAAS